MAENFADLKDTIQDELRIDEWPLTQLSEDILEWLDKHRDQVPGRMITESEFDQRTSLCSELETHWFKVGYFAAGGNIVADPEPTNAEKLEAALRRCNYAGGPEYIAQQLDELGVTAPEGGNQ